MTKQEFDQSIGQWVAYLGGLVLASGLYAYGHAVLGILLAMAVSLIYPGARDDD